MGFFDVKYLSKAHMKGFDSYKYSCIDSSPISNYISHPFWNWLVTFYPRTWAPNVLTLIGWSLVMGCFLLESVIDYDLSSNSVGSNHPINDWFWLTAAICTWIGYTLDGTDGKQARRIGASGPTGELFDHGLDSWSTVPFTITIFSIFGRGEFSVSPIHLLCVLISVQIVFIVSHWEKYNTGVLYLSWGYDASQYTLIFFYILTYIVGYKWYKFYVFDGVSFATLLESSFYFCCLASVIVSLYNMWFAYAVDKTFKQSSFYEASRPIIPCVILFSVSLGWAYYSPTDICGTDPRLFFFAMGTVFSNIACRLVIAQMSNQRCEVNNGLLLLYVVVACVSLLVPALELQLLRLSTLLILLFHIHYGVCVCRLVIAQMSNQRCEVNNGLLLLYVVVACVSLLVPALELQLLRLSTLLILLFHIHYGVCVVRQLCAHFKIHALDVSYLQN
ncbi:CDP-alcohol phosphatidyltransferase [Dictyocaulus viviparus]|uniref:CDP-alcohol phosphatidyltransferase n=1 Tax=Dictyocaulus viviparus TaxID=29172 RepID=A0A0D8Y6H8_DICVI|nr:CDP-alcohol phosphatidyltransferase [Dictyocaulus viviparus]